MEDPVEQTEMASDTGCRLFRCACDEPNRPAFSTGITDECKDGIAIWPIGRLALGPRRNFTLEDVLALRRPIDGRKDQPRPTQQ